MRIDYKKTLLLGFGFMATTIAWAVYNAYVPLILEGYIGSTFFIGMIMTIDNIFGVVLQPVFGSISDKSKSKMGRRMPFILFGVPVCAALLIFIPWTTGVLPIMTVIIVFNFVMSIWRAPVVALMPDLTPSPLRSKANGIINLMGGIGTLLVFVLGGVLFNIGGMPLPFLFSAIVMLVAVLVLKIFVKEPTQEQVLQEIQQEKENAIELSASEIKSRKKSLMFLLFAILFWFMAYGAVETFFTLYATNTLTNAQGFPLSAGDATIMLGAFSLMYLLFAIPAGILGSKFGRKKVILCGLIGVIVIFSIMFFTTELVAVWVLLILAGIFWSFVAINSYPMVVDIGAAGTAGKYTGFYYFFSFAASIISPILFGALRDTVGSYQILFAYAAIAFVIAMLLVLFVKHGEAKNVPKDLFIAKGK